MITPVANINSTPMSPYIAILKSLSRKDRQIVIEFLQHYPIAEDSSVDSIETTVREKYNIHESPETQWLKNHSVTLSSDESSDERTQYILGNK